MKFYPVMWGLFHKPWNKDPYEPTWLGKTIQKKNRRQTLPGDSSPDLFIPRSLEVTSNLWKDHVFTFPKRYMVVLPSLKLTAKVPENSPSQKETIVFQPSIFKGELLVSGRVDNLWVGHDWDIPFLGGIWFGYAMDLFKLWLVLTAKKNAKGCVWS